MKLALDLDGVLADLQHAVIEHTEYTSSDFDQWDKPDYNNFISEASRVWSDHTMDIPPVEHNLDLKTAQLDSEHHVDIVTNTVGSDEDIIPWLDHHGIQYESIVRPYSMSCDKPDLDYDAYIDDRPGMASQVPVHYIRDQKWNQRVRGGSGYLYHSYETCYVNSEGLPKNHFESDLPFVVRVTDLNDVIYDLKNHS